MSHFPRTIEYLIGIYFPQDAYNYYYDHTILCKRVQYYAHTLLVLLLLYTYILLCMK